MSSRIHLPACLTQKSGKRATTLAFRIGGQRRYSTLPGRPPKNGSSVMACETTPIVPILCEAIGNQPCKRTLVIVGFSHK